jgi:hypothetical protein
MIDLLEATYREEEGVKRTLDRCINHITPLPAAYLTLLSRKISSSRDDRMYLVYLEPEALEYLLTIPESHFPVTGPDAVAGSIGGPWDRHKKPFKETEEYVSIHQYLVDGIPWNETPKGRRRVRQNRSERWIRRESDHIAELAGRIRGEGYRSQTELVESGYEGSVEKRQVRSIEIPDEILVGLGRNNELIRLSGGRHRVAIAQILDVDSIPAILTLRHGSSDLRYADIQPEYVTETTGRNANWRPVV